MNSPPRRNLRFLAILLLLMAALFGCRAVLNNAHNHSYQRPTKRTLQKTKTMPTQIPRGATTQVDLNSTYPISTPPDFTWRVDGSPLENGYVDNNNPDGWAVTQDGHITVPGDADAYTYAAQYISGGTVYTYLFEVVEQQACDFTISVEAVTAITQAQKGQASSIPFTVTCSRMVGSTVQWLAKAVSLAIDWGDGNNSTHTVNTSALGPTPVSVAHAYATRGTKTVTATGTVNGCSGSGTGSGSVQVVDYRWKCESGQCLKYDVTDGSGYATEAECLASGCGFPGAGWYCVLSGGSQTATQLADGAAWVAAGRPTPKYGSQIECPCYVGPVWWCVNGVPVSGTNPPSGVTTYISEQACRDAGCSSVTPTYTRWKCSAQGLCVSFQTTNPTEGFKNCVDANCSGIVETPIYRRFRCNSRNQCEEFYTPNPYEGYEDCSAANCTPPVDPCHYNSYSIADKSSGNTLLTLALFRKTNPGWSIVVTHAINGVPQPNPTIQTTDEWWNWSVPKTQGAHNFIAQLTKPGCPTEIQDRTVYVEVPPPPTNPGGQDCPDCPECPPYPPLPEEFECSPAITIQLPAANATLGNFAVVRVQVSDPNEETDACHHNYSRPCNDAIDGPDLQVFLGAYGVPSTWKHISGSKLNGIWEGRFDTRDYSNGSKTLRVSMRGVGCCRVSNTRSVSLSNTLQGGVFYRDTRRSVRSGFVIPDAMIGVETRALEENKARRYWLQHGVRSGTALDGPYQHADWAKHQPVILTLGEVQSAQGNRIERRNYSGRVALRLPHSNSIRAREKWTPQFVLGCFDLDAQRVVKIRQVSPGLHYLWTQTPGRLWTYDGEQVKLLGDFDDNSNLNAWAPDAVDAALWVSDAGRKIIVIAPESEEHPSGEVFAFDPDAGEVTMNYSVRNHTLVPGFVEVVGGVPIALYTSDTLTHAYDLRFGAPKRVWTFPDRVTQCFVDGDTLLVGFGSKLYATSGLVAPTLVRDFGDDVTAASQTYVGLSNGEVWKKSSLGWSMVNELDEAVGGVAAWAGGIESESNDDPALGVVGGDGDWLSSERSDGTWFDERELVVPPDLAPRTVLTVTALDLFLVAGTGSESGAGAASRDERLLVGTGDSGLLYVYQRSALSEKDGAIPVSHDIAQRVFPFYKAAVTS